LRLIYQSDFVNQSFLLNEYSSEQEIGNQGENSQTNDDLQKKPLVFQEEEEEE